MRLMRCDRSIRLSGLVEVLDGLRPGDRVATSGALFIDRAVRAG